MPMVNLLGLTEMHRALFGGPSSGWKVVFIFPVFYLVQITGFRVECLTILCLDWTGKEVRISQSFRNPFSPIGMLRLLHRMPMNEGSGPICQLPARSPQAVSL
jgi:hypothetical protein